MYLVPILWTYSIQAKRHIDAVAQTVAVAGGSDNPGAALHDVISSAEEAICVHDMLDDLQSRDELHWFAPRKLVLEVRRPIQPTLISHQLGIPIVEADRSNSVSPDDQLRELPLIDSESNQFEPGRSSLRRPPGTQHNVGSETGHRRQELSGRPRPRSTRLPMVDRRRRTQIDPVAQKRRFRSLGILSINVRPKWSAIH